MKLYEAEEWLIALREVSDHKYRLHSSRATWGVEAEKPGGGWHPLTEKEIKTIVGL